jgi:hypothetical protein
MPQPTSKEYRMTSEPEVAAAQTALDALPSEWTSPALIASVLRRAALVAVHRKVNAQVAAAQSSVASTLAAIDSGDVADETLAALAGGRAALAGKLDLQSVLPAPSIDSSACAVALECADRAAAQCGMLAPLVLDYEDELVRWRSFARTSSDAPIATDRDRAAKALWLDADGRVKAWKQGLALCRSLNLGSNDVLGMLAGAQGCIDRAAELAPVVEAANESTLAANTARKAAGLNWSPS